MAPTDEEIDVWSSLRRYSAGVATPEEIDRLSAYLGSHPDQHVGVSALRRLVDDLPGTIPDSTTALAALRTRLNDLSVLTPGAAPIPGVPPYRSIARRSRFSGWTPRRAIVTGALGGALAFGAALLVRGRSPDDSPATTYTTARAQTAVVSLRNGTRMTLAPATVAVVSANGEVTLTGEAQFSVQPNAKRAFVVRTKNAMVEVLGTMFSVRRYPEDAVSRVVVEEGRVGLRAAHGSNQSTNTHVLTARMLATVADSAVDILSDVPVQNYTSWATGKMVLSDVPLQTAIAELERAYDVHIRVADSALFNRKVTLAASLRTQSAAEVLELVARTIDAHTTQGKDGFVIAPGRLSRNAPRYQTFPSRKSPETQYGK